MADSDPLKWIPCLRPLKNAVELMGSLQSKCTNPVSRRMKLLLDKKIILHAKREGGGGGAYNLFFSWKGGGGVIERGSLIKDVWEIQPFHLEISINSFRNPQTTPRPPPTASHTTDWKWGCHFILGQYNIASDIACIFEVWSTLALSWRISQGIYTNHKWER